MHMEKGKTRIMGIVYRATSMTTRKSYIGVTTKSLYHRQQAYLDTGTNDRYIRDCCNDDWIRDPGHSDWKFEWANKSEVNVEPILRENRRRIK